MFVEARREGAEMGSWDKGGLLRKPIKASRQSVVPRGGGLLFLLLLVHGTWICRAETLKSHQICRAALSFSPYRRMREPLIDIRTGKKVARPESRFTRFSFFVLLVFLSLHVFRFDGYPGSCVNRSRENMRKHIVDFPSKFSLMYGKYTRGGFIFFSKIYFKFLFKNRSESVVTFDNKYWSTIFHELANTLYLIE